MDQDRTEDPTAKRREKFREEGKVATSRDLGGVAVVAAIMLLFIMAGERIFGVLAELYIDVSTTSAVAASTPSAPLVDKAIAAAGAATAAALAAPVGVAAIVAVSTGLAQTGGNVSTEAFEFKWERLDIIAGLRRSFGSVDSLVQIAMAIAKATVLGSSLGLVLWDARPELVGLSRIGLGAAFVYLGGLVLRLMTIALVASTALGFVDLLWSRHRMTEQMRMTKQEVKDEHKQQEGDPAIRGQMRQRMREIGRNQMIAGARDADVVVVNPTHYAVALAYKFGQAGAPKLLAKGKDAVAGRIREVARRNQIPIVANPPVARAIHAGARVGEEVPPELYETVAKVIALLFRIHRRRSAP